MMPRLSSSRPRIVLRCRLRRWFRWAWLDMLPVSGWVKGWRRERRHKQLTGTRPEVPRLRPEYDAFEERSFLGLDFTSAVQVALVGAGAMLVRELFASTAQAATPATPLPAPQAALRGEEPPAKPSGGGGGGGGEDGRHWATPREHHNVRLR